MKKVRYMYLFAVVFLHSGFLNMCFASVYLDSDSSCHNCNRTFLFQHSSSPVSVYDTVIFDLGSSYQVSGEIELPVSFRSADSIYSLDFAFQYNEQEITVDSVFTSLTGLQYLYHYNTSDSTFRFTSNLLVPMPNDSVIVTVRFHVYSGPVCTDDVYNVECWLNGNSSTATVLNCVVSSVADAEDNKINAWPVPASSELNIRAPGIELMTISDANGYRLPMPFQKTDDQNAVADVSGLPAGIYFLNIQSAKSVSNIKIVIAR